ncbi:MAG: ABC transporter substrate-binding protein [Caldilineaceae bacterium]|nr:ABC transporter substrate-binding protein [Caldilineaceae bacterium]
MRNLPLLLLFSLLLAACSPVAPGIQPASQSESQPPLRGIKLGVGFVPNVQFAPFYVGIEKGFFAEEGIDLSLDYGFENDYLKLVGTDALQFMIGSSDQLVLGQAQGLPVKYVMNWYSQYPVTIFAKAEAGIVEPADLAGKRVGVPGPFGATYIALRALLDIAGLTESDIQMESIGFTQAAAVSQGLVDAAADYAVNGPVVLAAEGIETTQIGLDIYLRIPANGLVTNDATLTNQPELVRAMIRASLKAIAYTVQNPDEAFAISLKFIPEADSDNSAVNRAVFDASLAYWVPKSGQTPGATDPADWQTTAELLARIGLVDRVVESSSLFSNDYLP